jgi:AcrR family transcriptional regulator
MTTTDAGATTTRDRVIRAAAELLTSGGRHAVSTRAISAQAGVQAPTLYRLFGDKQGLLDAVASFGFEEYLADKHAQGETGDPVEDLRRGWDLHVEFGLSHPAFYELMYGDARAGMTSSAGREAQAVLRRLVARIASADRLTMSVERAARLVHSSGVGVVFSLIALPPEERDGELSVLTREMVIRTITTDAPSTSDTRLATRAVALTEALRTAEPSVLSPAERTLLTEWLNRLAEARS